MNPFARLVRSLLTAQVRFVVIGVWGANYYARGGGTMFTTRDRDLFLPLDAGTVLRAWQACADEGLTLWAGDEPLDMPRDIQLAQAVLDRRAGTTATGQPDLQVDLTVVMAGFKFEDVWNRRRLFIVDDVEIPVASLTDIVTSKAKAARPKDRLFLATHEHALRELLEREPDAGET